MSLDLLEVTAELAAVQASAALHQRIVELAMNCPSTARCALFIDEFGELAHVSGPRDAPTNGGEGGPTWLGSWRLVPLKACGQRQGLLVLERTDGTEAAIEPIAIHIGHALAAASNYAMLEELVSQEMATAVAREQAIQLILDNMTQGLLVVDLQGKPTEVRSATVAEWLGPVPDDDVVWPWLAGTDDALASRFDHHFEQIAADLLPFEVSASQMPARIVRGQRTFDLRFSQVEEDGVLARVLITITDITSALEVERQEAARREMEQVLRCVLSNIQGFRDGLHEMQRLLGDLPVAEEPSVRARLLHTIKGNSAILGFSRFAHEIHDVETMLLERGGTWAPEVMDRIRTEWSAAFDFVKPLVADDDGRTIQVYRDEYRRLLARLEQEGADATTLDDVASWTAPSLGGTFARFARSAERLATAHGKRVEVVTSGDDVRVRSDEQRAVLSAVAHVVRNAMEHGVETIDERTAAGKPETARLSLSADQRDGVLVLTVEDDGRGIDVEAVRSNGARIGVAPETDLFACLCAGSTRETVSESSGRGLGMAALKEAVDAVGGSVSIETRPGRGTTFVIAAPRHRAQEGQSSAVTS